MCRQLSTSLCEDYGIVSITDSAELDAPTRLAANSGLHVPRISHCATDGRPGKGDIRTQPLAPVRRRRIPFSQVDGMTISYLLAGIDSMCTACKPCREFPPVPA